MAWAVAFCRRELGPAKRNFTLAACRGLRAVVKIAKGASPWGLGATLVVAEEAIAHIAGELCAHDGRILGHARVSAGAGADASPEPPSQPRQSVRPRRS